MALTRAEKRRIARRTWKQLRKRQKSTSLSDVIRVADRQIEGR